MRRNSKRALAMILPAFAMASVIGAGYSTWFFGSTEIKGTDSRLNITVVGYTDMGVLNIDTSNATLTLDQRGTGGEADIGNSNGLSITGEVKYTHTATVGAADGYDFELTDYHYSITVTYTGDITNYLSIGAGDLSTKTYSDSQPDFAFITPTSNSGVTLNEEDLKKLVNPTWKKVPESLGEYTEMRNAMESSTIDITVTATYNPAGN